MEEQKEEQRAKVSIISGEAPDKNEKEGGRRAYLGGSHVRRRREEKEAKRRWWFEGLLCLNQRLPK